MAQMSRSVRIIGGNSGAQKGRSTLFSNKTDFSIKSCDNSDLNVVLAKPFVEFKRLFIDLKDMFF